jgi:hypothetical protein
MRKKGSLMLIIALVCLIFPTGLTSSEDMQYSHVLTIQSPDVASDTYFGNSIACDKDIIVVSEPWSTVEGNYRAGKVYIFDSIGNITASLQSPTPVVGAKFGGSVDFNGAYVVVGEPSLEINGLGYAGKAYIFDIDGNLHAALTPPEPNHAGLFGYKVAISGDKLVVSESGANYEGFLHAGMVHVYDLDGNLLTTFHSPEPFEGGGSGGNFGYSLAFNGNIIVVGEVYTTVDDLIGAGRAFLFSLNGDLITSIESPEPQTEGGFGQSVTINNDIILIGENYAEVDGYSKAGKVHAFGLDGNYLYTLQSPKPEEAALFGNKVAASEDLIIVCEPDADGVSNNEGLVHLYGLDGSFITSLKAPQPTANAEFGSFVAVSGETIAVGDRSTVMGEYKAGRVHIFKLGPPVEQPGPTGQVTPTPQETPRPGEGEIPGFPIWSIVIAIVIISLIIRRNVLGPHKSNEVT